MSQRQSATRDMTSGSIVRQIIAFSLPLMFGNIFQMLYNTVDTYVVGNYVSTQALAAVGSTTMIVNMLVFFFNGFSVGAGVVIARHFGAKDMQQLHTAVETTMAVTFLMCAVFTFVGMAGVRPMLRMMSTPEDVMDDATSYLTTYFMGISGLLVYNMGSGVLRAVGDTRRPLFFLVLTSVLNIILDLFFVITLHMGIAGVAWATVISQLISAVLTLALLTRSTDIYRLTWKDLRVDMCVLRDMMRVGLPAGIQSVITAFSNVFVQSYINYFGSACMAGWSVYNKLDSYIMLPMQSTAMAATTFVSQNIGAGKLMRVKQGVAVSVSLSVAVTGVIALCLFLFAEPAVGLFTDDPAVIAFGALFMHCNVFFLLANCVNHTLAGALRGMGDSRGPMIVMLSCFVGLRQVYLFVLTRFIANAPMLVGLGYPVGWVTCCIAELTYFALKWGKDLKKAEIAPAEESA
ncbi:MAG: MATE family efflux transporter [Clostridia bacterium]|nr:MATE family efflux transporter [Clostridia bacterium]